MNNLLTATQMRKADEYTIERQGISPIDLMERASKAFVKVFCKKFRDKEKAISILCGQGDNGGDGLAIARLLHQHNYRNISVYLIHFRTKQSIGYIENLERLAATNISLNLITEPNQFQVGAASLIIDAILGSGLNKPFTGKYAELASKVNASGKTIVAVDVPSGFPVEGIIDKVYSGIKADLVICFQRAKLNFFFPESILALDRFIVVDIGLDEDFIEREPSYWKLISEPAIKRRQNFTHKGTYGHALIVAGNKITMGAAILCAQACLRVGAGLTTLCLPESGFAVVNTVLPEVMTLSILNRIGDDFLSKITAIAIGPGLGINFTNEDFIEQFNKWKKPLVIDADALSTLANKKQLFDKLPEQTILTPHLKEFDRLFGEHQSWWDRVQSAKKQAIERKLIIILKNQYTFICLPNGEVHINQTGNPAMASGGMGDVLTGMIVGFLAQSYSPVEAALISVYLHGKAGDELAKKRFTVSASQVAKRIPKTLKKIR